MAESKENPITYGLSGMIGNIIVFRQRAGKTVVANVPKDSKKKPSKDQLLIRERFQQGTIYAKTAMKDPEKKALYEARARDGKTAYNVAISDFFHAPQISNVDVSNYTGAAGSTIVMRVTDDVMVTGVSVTIADAEGKVIEKGDAKVDDNGLDYTYTATTDNPKIAGDVVTVSATDLPNNVTKLSVTL